MLSARQVNVAFKGKKPGIYRNPLDSSIIFFSPNGRRPRVAGSPDIPKQDFVRVSRSFGIYRNPLDSSIIFFSPKCRRPRVAGSPDIPKQDFVRVSRSSGITIVKQLNRKLKTLYILPLKTEILDRLLPLITKITYLFTTPKVYLLFQIA